MHGREARSLSWVKIGTQVKILTLISAENFPCTKLCKNWSTCTKTSEYRKLKYFGPVSASSSVVLTIVKAWQEECSFCSPSRVFTEQHEGGIVQPKRPFGTGCGVVGGRWREGHRKTKPSLYPVGMLSVLDDHPKWFWHGGDRDQCLCKENLETFAIPSPLLRCQLDLFGVMQLRCLSAVDKTCQWPSSHFHISPTKNIFEQISHHCAWYRPISSIWFDKL